MLDILSIVPGKKRRTSSGWHVFNAVCCHHRGHNADKRQRAGIKFHDAADWAYSCFNCGFRCGFNLGKQFSVNLKQLLVWCGVDRDTIDKWSFESFSKRAGLDLWVQKKEFKKPVFVEASLPEGARPIDPQRDHIHIEYLSKRGLNYTIYPFHVVDGEARTRIIIPYFWRGKIVGNTSRYYDDRHPKYISDGQRGYVFNVDGQQPDWSACILVEGQFDALSIGGCAVMTNNISDEQAQVLGDLHRQIIFVPDRDKSGMAACNRALELGYSVSIPNWSNGVKDVNDAVRKYGRLPTLISILEGQTTSRIIVEMKRKKLV